MLRELWEFIGWDGLSYAEQGAVVLYASICAGSGFILAMVLLAIFGFSPRPAPASVKAKPKAKKGKKAKRKGGR